MKKLTQFFLLLLISSIAAFSQAIPFNNRGNWQASTLYTVGDYFLTTAGGTCAKSTVYYVAVTYISGSGCLLSTTGNADLVELNYTGFSSIPDEVLSLSYPRIVNNIYYLTQHMHDIQTYNDWTQISSPVAPSTGKLRVYAKSNAICWIPPGGSESCTTSVTTGGDISGPIGSVSVDKIKGKALCINPNPSDLQYLGWNGTNSCYEAKTLPTSVNPAGSDGDYQKKLGANLSAGSLKEDANNPYSTKAFHTPAASITFSATPTFDVAVANRLEITLTGNVTSSTWAHLRAGAKFSIVVTQGTPGSYTVAWPLSTLNTCVPLKPVNSVSTIDFEVALDGATVYAKNCSGYDPANPGVLVGGLERNTIPTPNPNNFWAGGDSNGHVWRHIANGQTSSTVVGIAAPSDYNEVGYIDTNGVQQRTVRSVNAQTGAGYTIVVGDVRKLVTLSNASAQTVNLPASAPANGWWLDIANVGTAVWTLSGNGLNINGAANTLTIAPSTGIHIVSDGTGYITVEGIGNSHTANAQTGTTYTFLATDRGKVVTFNNGSAVAVTLPQASSSNTFRNGWFVFAKNIGAGTVTITPTTSTISGTTSITLETGEFALITSDGTNYEAQTDRITAGSNITVTKSRTGTQVAANSGGVTLAAGTGPVCFIEPCMYSGGGSNSTYVQNRVYYFRSTIQVTFSLKQYLMYVQPGVTTATHYAFALMDSNCNKVAGTDYNYTATGGSQYVATTLSSPPQIVPGQYYLAVVTDAAAGSVFSWSSPESFLINGAYAGYTGRAASGSTAPTGTGATLAVPSSCGTLTTVASGFIPITYLLP